MIMFDNLPQGVGTLAEDFYSNRNVCRQEPVMLEIGEECYVVDEQHVDEDDNPALIPCVVLRIDKSPRFPNRWYYVLAAKDSVNDDQLNQLKENGISFYCVKECTSPHLFKILETIDLTPKEEEQKK